ETLREKKIAQIIVYAQAAIRGYLARQQHKLILARIDGIRLIQRNWRTYLALKDWPWWKAFTRARPLINIHKQDQEMKEAKNKIEELKKKIESEIEAKKELLGEKEDIEIELKNLKDKLTQV